MEATNGRGERPGAAHFYLKLSSFWMLLGTLSLAHLIFLPPWKTLLKRHEPL